MKLHKLLRIDVPELATRSRQEAAKRLDRARLAAGRDLGSPARIFSNTVAEDGLYGFQPGLPGARSARLAGMLFDRFQETAPARFFEGAADGRIPTLLAEQMPEACRQVMAVADKAARKRFDLLAYRGLFFGDPIDWHLDPLSRRRAAFVHWSRLDPLDAEAVGDSKVVWELNRHQWMVHLGQAYRLSADERHAETFAAAIQDWMQANPPGIGINWASSLEVALRLIAWCWALFLFRGSKALTPELFVKILNGIYLHAAHVEKYLSYYFSPNTHLTGEALGLFYAGTIFKELRPAVRWRALGARILVEQNSRQVLSDGVYFEQSTCYQRYTLETYLHFLILAARNGMEVATEVRERTEGMLDFLLSVRSSDGSMPQIGDADGGWVLPLGSLAPGDFRGLFSTAAALFNRSDCAWAAGALAPETLWLLGLPGRNAFEALRPAAPVAPDGAAFCLFAEGGYTVMRSGWERRSHHLIFDHGPLGCPVSAGHGHADLLSIQCSVFGEPYLVDPGNYCYAGNQEWRNFFRGTSAHSTVMVDGLDHAVPASAFSWETHPRAQLRQWFSSEGFDFADAEHDAYRSLPDPVIHRRRVLFVKPRYWVLIDEFDGKAEHRLQLQFQFAPLQLTVDSELWARARGRLGHGLLIGPFAKGPLQAEVFKGAVEPIQGWISPNYGQRCVAPLLKYSAVARLPLRIITLLLPVEDPLAPPPEVTISGADSAGPLGLFFPQWRESVRFDGQDFAVERG